MSQVLQLKTQADHSGAPLFRGPITEIKAPRKQRKVAKKVVAKKERGNLMAQAAALTLTGVAGYCSILGLEALMPGAGSVCGVPVAVAFGSAVEFAKIAIAKFKVSSRWMPAKVAGLGLLMVVTSSGVYGFFAKAHLEHSVLASANVSQQATSSAAEIEAQRAKIENMQNQINNANAIAKSASDKGRTKTAGNQATNSAKLAADVAAERTKLVAMINKGGSVNMEQAKLEADLGPVKYLAKLTGMDTETAVLVFILLLVLSCDPIAVMLWAMSKDKQEPVVVAQKKQPRRRAKAKKAA